MSMFNVDVYFLFNEKTKAHSAFANCRAGETWQIPIWFELACVCVCVCAHMVEGIGPAPRQRALEMCRTQAVVFLRLPLSLSLSRLPPWPHISPVTAAQARAKHKQPPSHCCAFPAWLDIVENVCIVSWMQGILSPFSAQTGKAVLNPLQQ